MSDLLINLVVGSLTDELRRPPWRGSENPLAGHCYVASEALYHFLGGEPWVPQFVRHEGSPHWFLKNRETGEVLDSTAGQFATPVPYDKARGKGFLTRQPSKRARVVLQRVLDGY